MSEARPPFPPPRRTLSDGEVRLRAWRESDVPRLVALLQDPEIGRWMGMPFPYTEAHAREFVAGRAVRERSFAIVTAADEDELLGGIGLSPAEPGAGRIGYWAAAPSRGRGIVPRAIDLVAEWALGELRLRRLEILTLVGNRPSQRAAAKAGFRCEGVRREGLTRPDGPVDAVVLVRE